MKKPLRCAQSDRCASSTRSAAVLFVVLVSIGVVTVVLVTILKLMTAEQRMLQTQQWQAQAAWLAESGLERAAARLAENPAYSGETWAVPPGLLETTRPASVRISVETIPGQPARRAVRVVADYPDQPQNRVRRSRQAVLNLSQGDTQA